MNKTLLISGGNRGIGLCIARELYRRGYQLSLGVRDPAACPPIAEPDADAVQYCRYDALDRASAQQWVEQASERFGAIDGVVLCAGILRPYSLEQDDESDLEAMWAINVVAPMRLIRAALPQLKRSGEGRVISLVSMSGKRVKGLSAGYAMSKHAQMALHQSVRNIGWEHGIRATAICPSWVNTEMAAISQLSPEQMTQPEDVARLVATVLALPNTAAVPEVTMNCMLEY